MKVIILLTVTYFEEGRRGDCEEEYDDLAS